MKKIILVLFIVLLLLSLFFLLSGQPEDIEKESIRLVALDYVQGWYEGDAARMERALHPELVKRGVQVMPQTGKVILSYAGASNMVEYTRASAGKNLEKKERVEVTVLDVFKMTASVKIISPDFIDYLHLVKREGKWQILNVLWEPNK